MELRNIEAFLMVVEKGSFSTAAEALFITQPTISSRIQMLEQELNASLFSRANGKRVTLSPAGEKVLPYFRQAHELIQKGMTAAQEAPVKKDRIAIYCPNHMGVDILPGLLEELYHQYPNIDFPVKIEVSKKIIEDIRNGNADVGFAYLESPKIDKDLTVIRIAIIKNILVAAPEHPLTKEKAVNLTDLVNERIITYSKTFLNTKSIQKFLQVGGLTDYQTTEITNLGWLKMMVRKGMGIAFLQKAIVSDELKKNLLVEIPIVKPLPSTSLYLLFKPTIQEDIKTSIIQIAEGLFNNV